MSKWTAVEISLYDQFLAGADEEVDRLMLALQVGTRDHGEHQAMANMILLVSERGPAAIAGLLMTALRRLAAESGEDNDSERAGQ